MAVVQYSNVYRQGAASGSPVTSLYVCDNYSERDSIVPIFGDLLLAKDYPIFFYYASGIWQPLIIQSMPLPLTGDVTIQKDTPILRLIDNASPVNARAWNYTNFSGGIYIQPTDDGGGAVISAIQALRNGDVTIGRNLAAANFFEKARSVALGGTQIFNYSSGNVWANGGSVSTNGPNNWFRYNLIGDRLHCSFFITLNIAAGSDTIYMHTPEGRYTASNLGIELAPCIFYDTATAHALGRVLITGGQNYLSFTKSPVTQITAGLIEISGQLNFATTFQ